MAADPNSDSKGVDVRKVQALAALMSRHDLTLIDLRDGPVHIEMRRGHAAPSAAPVYAAAPAPESATRSAPTTAQPAADAPSKPARTLHEIKSIAVGTFYAQEKPGAPPYVRVGDRVTPKTVVCKIEAMKIFNDITADCSGVLAEILVEDKQPVEFGQVLFRVDPNG